MESIEGARYSGITGTEQYPCFDPRYLIIDLDIYLHYDWRPILRSGRFPADIKMKARRSQRSLKQLIT